jgi:hypothetical protein
MKPSLHSLSFLLISSQSFDCHLKRLNHFSESELLYDWWFTANQFVLATTPWASRLVILVSNWGYSPYVTSSLTRGWVYRLQLLLSLVSAVILTSEFHGTHDHILLPKPGGPEPRIYISQEQGGPVITPGTGFPFRRLLRLAGLGWRLKILIT